MWERVLTTPGLAWAQEGRVRRVDRIYRATWWHQGAGGRENGALSWRPAPRGGEWGAGGRSSCVCVLCWQSEKVITTRERESYVGGGGTARAQQTRGREHKVTVRPRHNWHRDEACWRQKVHQTDLAGGFVDWPNCWLYLYTFLSFHWNFFYKRNWMWIEPSGTTEQFSWLDTSHYHKQRFFS